MKSATDWFGEITRLRLDAPMPSPEETGSVWVLMSVSKIEAIQLDAYKAGMTQAAEIARPMYGETSAVMDDILAARDAKTTL